MTQTLTTLVLSLLLSAGASAQRSERDPSLVLGDDPPPPLALTPSASHPRDDRLVPGVRVKIEGRAQQDGCLTAHLLRLRAPDETVTLAGPIHSIDRHGRRLMMLGVEVSTEADPYLDGGQRGDLSVGRPVEIEGRWSGARVYASRVRIRGAANSVPEPDAIEAEIEDIDSNTGTIVVLGRQVLLPAVATIVDERSPKGLQAQPIAGVVAEEPTQPEPPPQPEPYSYTSGGRRDPFVSLLSRSEEPRPLSESQDRAIDRLRRDDDEQRVISVQLGERMVLGGRIKASFDRRGNFDLTLGEDDTSDRVTSRAQLQSSVQLTERIELYSKLAIGRRFSHVDSRWRARADDFRVAEAYLFFNQIGGSAVSLQIGRQLFRDARGWAFDRILDAVRWRLESGAWEFEGAAAYSLFAGSTSGPERDPLHVIGSATKRIGRRARVSGFVVHRDEHGPEAEDPLWLGTSIGGDVTRAVKYWAELALRRASAASIARYGWAVDSGGTFRLPGPGSLSLTFGYAAASGAQLTEDGVDSSFRQTGLESNRALFEGLRRVSFYGEVFDPRLSNLRILTVVAGLGPSRHVSVDTVFHRYDQRHPRLRLAENDLRARATGLSSELGHEVDLVLTIRHRPVDIAFVSGVFLPGPGFDSQASPAFLLTPQIRIYF